MTEVGEYEQTGRETEHRFGFDLHLVRYEHGRKKIFTRRTVNMAEEAAQRAGLRVKELNERIEADDRLGDLVVEAVERSRVRGDEDYLTVIGRLVGAACDDARVDEVAFLLGQVVKLEPLHLRTLMLGCDFIRDDEVRRADYVPPNNPYAGGDGPMIRCLPQDAEVFSTLALDDEVVRAQLGEEIRDVVPSVFTRLVAEGLLEPIEVQHLGHSINRPAWKLTRTAKAFVRMVFDCPCYDDGETDYQIVTPPGHQFEQLEKIYPPRDYTDDGPWARSNRQ